MAAKETIFQKCISLHGVPENIGADVLRHEIQQQHSVTVVRIEEVIGAEANRNLKRWIMELEGELYVNGLKRKFLEINSNGDSRTVEFKASIECELPSSWTMPQVPRNPKPTGRHQFNPQGPVAGQSTVYQNYDAAGGYTSQMSAPHTGASDKHLASQHGNHWEEGSREGSDQIHAQAGQGQEQMGPGNAPMGQMYGWMNPGYGQIGQGQQQMPYWQGHMGHGDIQGQGHAQRRQGQGKTDQGQGPIQMGQYEHFMSMIRHDPNSGQYFCFNGFQYVPVTEVYIQQAKAYFEGQQLALQQQQQIGHEPPPEVLPENSDAYTQESVEPDTTKQKVDLGKQNVGTEKEIKTMKDPLSKIKLTHLPGSVDEEYVQIHLESKRMGSLSVASVVLDNETGSAEVEMTSPEGANNLIEMRTFQMKGAQVFVEWLQVTTNELEEELNEDSTPSIIVTGFPEGTDEEEIRMFFENKRKFEYVEVVDVKFSDDSLSAIITYSSENDVDCVMNMCPLKLMGTVLKCERPQGRTHQKPESSKPLEPKVLVKGLPENIDEDDIRMFFENKRKFNHIQLVDVVWNAGSTSAVITFSSDNDVESVLDMCPLKLMGKELIVERLGSSDANEKPFNSHSKSSTNSMFDGTQTEILVEDIPPEVDKEMLEMCFSSRKLKSCTIEDIDIDEVDNNAVIKFLRPQDVKTVLDNLPLTIKKREVSVQIYVPKKLCTVIVRGPEGVMKEENDDTFEMYFENEKKSGGDDIHEISFRPSEKAFYITYKEEHVAKRVVERDNHCILKNKVKVELFKPSRSTKVSSEPMNEGSNTIYKRNKEDEHVKPESQPLKTVKIRGVRKVSSRDSVQWYFENKKKADGGEIESRFTDEEDDDVMYIKFKDESVAQAVAKKQHKLDGQELVVSLYTPPVPPPSYPNKLLIKGLNQKITFNVLDLYLEARVGITLVEGSMTYHAEQEDVVLVTVNEEIDFAKLEEACRLKALEGSYLRVSQVPISNCVLVSNISDTATVDMVSLYFENEKRSNGGPVDKVEMFSTQNYCLVYFADYKVVDRVLSKDQKLDGRQLEVRRYFPCIGRAEGDTVERRFKKPNPLTVKANIQKIKFLHRSSANKVAVEKQLSMCHATIIWPAANDTEDVELHCTLSEDVKDCVKLAKDWNDNAKASFQDFMNTLDVESVFVVQDILKKVTEELSKISIDNPEAVAILIQRQENKIYIVGIKGNVLGLKTKVEQIVKDIQDAAEKEKEWTKVEVKNLKPIETKMLLADKFPSQMLEKFPEVKINIHPTKNEIEIEGVYKVVNTIQIEMYKIKDTFVRNESQIQNETMAMFMSRPVKDYIVKKLKNDKVIAVWETVNGKLIVMSKHDTMLSKAVNIVTKSVSIGKVQLTKESRSSVQSEAWAALEKQLLEEHQGKLTVDKSLDEVAFVCTDDIFSKLLETINDFLDKNTIYSDKWSFAKNIHKLLRQHHNQNISDLAKGENVRVQFAENQIEVSGTKKGINKVRQELELLAQKVKKQQHKISKPGISQFMKTDKGHGILRSVESTYPVIVSSSDEDSGDEDYGIYSLTSTASSLPPGCSIIASCIAYEKRNIHVMFGNMTDLNVDAIVNAADEKLSLCGGLGKEILKKGGDTIARDCKLYIDAHGKLGEAAVFVSTSGNLKAKSIVHVAGPVWKDGMQQEDEKLTEVVFKAMHQASAKGYKSVALPAISCGAYGYPVKLATGVIVASVKNFFREVQESELTEIYLCDLKEDTVDGFVKGLEKEFGASSVHHFTRKQSSSALSLPPGSIRPMDSSDEESTGTYSADTSKGTFKPRPQPMNRALPVKLGNITVAVQKAEIAKHNIPVIVNTTSRNLDLNNGAVSKTILKQAGPEIQNELKQSYPNGIGEGQVAVTKGHKLKCTNVVHGAVSNWDGQKKTIDELKSFVNLCMEETQKRNHSGIAFPAIGTGNLGYPKEVVAREMLTAISEFATKHPQSCIKNVDFILYPQDEGTIKAFESEITQWAKGGGKGRARGYDHYQNLRSKSGEDGENEHLYEELPFAKDSNNFTIGNVQIKVTQGDLTKEAVDCIVNSSNETLDLKRGKVSQSLVKICGDQLVKEAHSKQKEMKKEGLAITKAYQLACKNILHVVAKETAQEWKQVVVKCLKKAKGEGYQSIAFPALGTGMNISAAETAHAMCQAVKEFANEGCGTLTDVRFVIFQKEMVDNFKHEAQGAQGMTGSEHGTKRKPSMTAARTQPRNTSTNVNSVCLIIHAMEVSDIRKAIDKINAMIADEVSTTRLSDSIIQRFDGTQESALRKIAEKHNVDFRPISDGVEIVGMMANVHHASTLMNKIIKDAIQIENDKQAAMILKDVVQWYYIDVTDEGDDLNAYGLDLNYKIEKAFKNQDSQFMYKEDSVEVVVDFNTLQEYEKDEKDDNKKTKIVRKDLIQDKLNEIPPDWKDMKGNLLVHTLLTTDPRYGTISTTFTSTAGANFAIQKIEMVQNKSLWQQYAAKKKQLEGQNPPGTTNERFLWHGTSADTVDSVNAHGFNRSYCGKNATVHGDGVYFAVNSAYSCSNTYSRPDANGVKKIYYCAVLTGEFTAGRGGMRVPPPKPSGGQNALYDSVTDNTVNPTMFIIFNDTQAYPLYIINVK
ncbi:protein mono-ADP-ribosyltransferase PARP14-like isoform X1 [Dreissena polymorpha]|uniref:protein mono-ADP-ribosyltransferase PARP14-like isoform X1 n=1 Tax=Dreissena polymorpha TaxID=45954 RepID=UPI00226565DE|nr:protein mono-ADP-ribosyltransferase PARP14-like isoform X1 [Dreissena polymorpha]